MSHFNYYIDRKKQSPNNFIFYIKKQKNVCLAVDGRSWRRPCSNIHYLYWKSNNIRNV